MFGLGMPELLVILLVVVVVFGPRRLPQVGQALGSSIRGFRKASRGEEDPPANVLPGKTGTSEKEPLTGTEPEIRPVSGCDFARDPAGKP